MTPLFSPTLLAVVLFVLGLAGLLARRNIIFMLMSLEIMMNAGGVALIGGGSRWGQADGQVMFFLVLAMAAAEVAVGLALVLQIFRRLHTIDADSINGMRG